jgi:putative peptidoglycan lipid II flippase
MIKLAGLGHAGLALSTSMVALFSFVVLFWILRNRIGGIYGRALGSSVLKITLASLVMGGAVLLSSRLVQMWLGISRLARLMDLAISIPVGLAVLYGGCRLLRVPELDLAARALVAPIGKWFADQRARIG